MPKNIIVLIETSKLLTHTCINEDFSTKNNDSI